MRRIDYSIPPKERYIRNATVSSLEKMTAVKNVILQINDSITGRAAALRLDRQDAQLPLGLLLDRYLLHPPLDRLTREGGITERSADTLFALQDLVYASSDSGQLMAMFAGVKFQQMDRPIEGGQLTGRAAPIRTFGPDIPRAVP